MDNYLSFENMFFDTLNHHVPLKKKLLRANLAPYATKSLQWSIIRRSNLQTKYFKIRTLESLKKIQKKNNLVDYIKKNVKRYSTT